MIRPPSAVRHYDYYYTGDPAFVQLEDGATDEQKAEHAHKWQVARETGQIADLLIPGASPTKFVLRPLPGSLFRKLYDRIAARQLGMAEAAALAFRCAVMSVENLGDVQVKRRADADYGEIATSAIVDVLDAIDLGIVAELGDQVIERSRQASPK